jgi:hypothetical protein
MIGFILINPNPDMENKRMRTTNHNTTLFAGWRVRRIDALAFILFAIVHARSSFAQATPPPSTLPQSTQARSFPSLREATAALFQAVHDDNEQAVETILGAGMDVTSSGDTLEDKREREQFSRKYQEMHRLVRERDGSAVLYIGAENWPFPVPLVSTNGQWRFDSDSGKKEILARRIGENEITAIQICKTFATRQNTAGETAAGEDPTAQFFESFVSLRSQNNELILFHGYAFRLVNGNSTARSKSLESVTLIAYPAHYRESGVMTFVVTRQGGIHQTDLGPNTAAVAPKLRSRTGSNWHPAA